MQAFGVLAYCGAHVAGFSALRSAAFPPLLHTTYRFGPLASELPYEFAKDALAYGLAATAFWLMLKWRGAPSPAVSAIDGPVTFDIRDGARLVRAPVVEILAIRSAGNYVEFLLSDGRRPLMRSPLSALEARLASCGFVRTHRSWLVNSARVTGVRPEGSGDYAVELGALEAPLSRRFPQALAALRP
jgi:DNA-binding LytR/AlgR family response regulator